MIPFQSVGRFGDEQDRIAGIESTACLREIKDHPLQFLGGRKRMSKLTTREVKRVLKAVAKIEAILDPFKRSNKEMIIQVAHILYGSR